MSEREPITNELRAALDVDREFMRADGTVVAQTFCVDRGDFERLCDAIDAVHASLERENAELRERVAVLDKRGGSMHDGGSITDELREYAEAYEGSATHASLDLIADRIDAEHEAQLNDAFETRNSDENLESDGWIRLPKDADGEYIQAGDVLDGYGKTIDVVELRYGRSGWVLISRDGNGYADTFAFTHYHAPTVEDVLTEFAAKLIERGELTNGASQTIAEYASKLRLAEEVDG